MLHKETLTVEKAAPRKPNIAVLDAKAKPHFNLANQIERSVNSGNFYPNETGLVNVPMLTVARNGGKKWD